MHGQIIACPHCGLSTVLRVPGYSEPQPPPLPKPPPVVSQPHPQTIYIREKPKTGCLTQFVAALLILFLLGFIVSLFNSASDSSRSNNTPSRGTVKANIRCTDTSIIIQNKDSTAWSDITVYLNGTPPFTYRANLGAFSPGETREFPLNEFAKKNGERFNPFGMKVVQVWIGGGGFDYSNYRL